MLKTNSLLDCENEDQTTCYFVNENKFYQFDLQAFIFCSKYFFKNRKSINVGTSIPLPLFDSSFQFSEDLIRNFISACEKNEQIELNVDNVYPLYELSKQYEISYLQKTTEDYISKNEEQLILQEYLYKFNQNDDHSNSVAEKKISENLMKYIDEDKLSTLHIAIIERILKKYRQYNPIKAQNDATEDDIAKETKVKYFFLKCLQRKERLISILFNFIDYERFSDECLEIIQRDYSDIFSYSFLYEKILKYLITHNFSKKDKKIDEKPNNEKQAKVKIEDEKEDEVCLKELNEIEDKIERCETLSHVELPNIKNIPKRFFSFVTSITFVKIPDSVVKISNGAFRESRSLTDVLFNETSKLETIEEYSFFGCQKLKNFEIPKTVTFIGLAAFMYCKQINVTIPPNLKTIEKRIFYGCNSLMSAIIPSQITSIEYNAFHNCTSLENLKLPDYIVRIEQQGFAGCSGITSIIFPASLKRIIINAFYGCKGLKEIQFSSAVDLIDSDSFFECSSLEIVKFLSSIKIIKENAFHNCSKLKEIQFSTSPETIESNSFNGCTSIETITFPTSVKVVNSESFNECSGLKTIKYIGSVETIETDAFKGCSSLQTIEFLSSVKIIKNKAFNECLKLNEIQFSSTPDSIQNNAFSGCSETHVVKFLASVKFIKEKAFLNCTELNEIHFLSDIESIESFAFKNCTSLQVVKFLSSVNHIQNEAFYGCSKLKEIFFASSIESIGDHAFEECKSLKKVEFPSSLRSLGYDAFYGVPNEVVFDNPSNIEYIGPAAFWTKYNNIEFPASSRKKIEDFAFGLDTVILKPSKK